MIIICNKTIPMSTGWYDFPAKVYHSVRAESTSWLGDCQHMHMMICICNNTYVFQQARPQQQQESSSRQTHTMELQKRERCERYDVRSFTAWLTTERDICAPLVDHFVRAPDCFLFSFYMKSTLADPLLPCSSRALAANWVEAIATRANGIVWVAKRMVITPRHAI